MQTHRHLRNDATLLFHLPLLPRSPPPCHRRPPCSKATPTATHKKPYGYWTHLPNVLSELESYMSTLPPPHTMPTAHELSLAGRADLAGAIRRHTWRKVAAAANLPLSSLARPRGLNLSFCTQLNTQRIRPHMYWRDWENLEMEIRKFIRVRAEESGAEGRIMPTAAELVNHGRSDLKRAISLHGGVGEVARRLGLVPKSHPAEYWDKDRVTKEVTRVMRCTESEHFPTVEELRRLGERGLPAAVRRLGGARAVAKRMGLSVRRKSQKT